MNLGQLKDEFYALVDDPSRGYFTEAQVERWLNNAQRETQKQLVECNSTYYIKCVKAAIVPNKACYYWPENFYKLNRFDVILSGEGTTSENRVTLDTLTPTELNLINNGPSVPLGFFTKKNTFELRPYPDQGYTIELLYSYRVADMTTDADIPDAPEEYHEYLVVLAVLDAFFKDQRDPSPFLAKKDYYLALMKQAATQRLINQPRSVVQAGGQGYYYY